MLPTYSRVVGNNSSTNVLFTRKSFRAREKCLILLVLVTFGFVCFGGLFFLPDNFTRAYKELKKAGPEIFIPAPPHGINSGEDQHIVDDRAKLAAKIKDEFGEILEKPETRPEAELEEGPMALPPLPDNVIENSNNNKVPSTAFNIEHGEDSDPLVRVKRNKVKEDGIKKKTNKCATTLHTYLLETER